MPALRTGRLAACRRTDPVTAARVLVVVLLAALGLALLPATGAQAAERTVDGGRLDWGIKASFQRYVTGPIAKGSWELNGGASTVGESQFRFHSAKGGYDPDAGSLDAAFSGGIRFLGHQKPDGTHELDLTISNPTVRITAGGSGMLHADMRSKSKGTGKVSFRSQVPMAALKLSGVDMRGGGTPVTLSSVPASLTAEGAKAFAGYYPAGTELDPVSLSADVTAGAGSGDDRGDGRKSGEKDAEDGKDGADAKDGKGAKDDAGKKPAARKGRFTAAAVDWGVRRTFREYVTGPIAEGKWKLSGGARDGGALYRFPAGKGSYDLAKGELDADFGGAVRFTGKKLNVALDKVAVKVRDGRGTLSSDGTPLVTFDAALTPEKGLIRLTERPAELTAEGSEFFGGMYQKGTSMAPVSLAVALDDKAELPALPDLGSGADTPSGAPSASPAAGPRAATAADSSDSAFGGTLAVALAAALLLAGGGFWFFRRQRRPAAAAAAPATAEAMAAPETTENNATPVTTEKPDNPEEQESR